MIALVVDRLKERCPGIVKVLLAEDLDMLEKGTAVPHGTAFVIPFRERASENALSSGGHRQLVTMQFLTAFVVRRHDDDRGAERALAFDGLKAEIEAALAGWAPSPEGEPCELVGGEGTPLGNGVSVYVQTWETSRILTGAPA